MHVETCTIQIHSAYLAECHYIHFYPWTSWSYSVLAFINMGKLWFFFYFYKKLYYYIIIYHSNIYGEHTNNVRYSCDKLRYVIDSFSASGEEKWNWVDLCIVAACYLLQPHFQIQCRTSAKEGRMVVTAISSFRHMERYSMQYGNLFHLRHWFNWK
jgi:hypothetical protein